MSHLEKTYHKERRRLLAWLKKRLRSEEEPEEVLQELFVKALEYSDPIENLSSWLYAAARNAVTDIWRKRSRGRQGQYKQGQTQSSSLVEQKQTEVDDSVLQILEDWEQSCPRSNPARQAWEAEAITVLNEAIDDLPEEQKEVFLLQALYGYSFAEVAELLDLSINTAMSRKRYAVAKLRQQLKDYGEVLQDYQNT